MKPPPTPPPPFSRPPAAGDKPRRFRFTPVPRLRKRRNGWTEETQRSFILALSRCGSVSRAARAVGMSARSAYRLLDADGADSFAKAWDRAIDTGIERVRIDALDRALYGRTVAVFRRGKLDRIEHRTNDRLAIALLSGGHRQPDLPRASAARRAHRQDLRVLDSARAEDGGSGPSVDAAVRFLVSRIEQEAAGGSVERTGREKPWPLQPPIRESEANEPAAPEPRRRGPRVLFL